MNSGKNGEWISTWSWTVGFYTIVKTKCMLEDLRGSWADSSRHWLRASWVPPRAVPGLDFWALQLAGLLALILSTKHWWRKGLPTPLVLLLGKWVPFYLSGFAGGICEAGPGCHWEHCICKQLAWELPSRGCLNILYTEPRPQHCLPETSECLRTQSYLEASLKGISSPTPSEQLRASGCPGPRAGISQKHSLPGGHSYVPVCVHETRTLVTLWVTT